MATIEAPTRPELLEADDAAIEDALGHADPMILRGLIYQLTGDRELKDMPVKSVMAGMFEAVVPASDEAAQMVRRKAAEFLKSYRDSGAGPIDPGPPERLPESMALAAGREVPPEHLPLQLEELALDPWARSLQWRERPDPERLENFSVAVVGTGMGGLNAAVQLKRAGIPFQVFEKNSGVGGTWYENRYPGARVDTPSRMYMHIFGVDFTFSQAFCDHRENRRYFDWVFENFGLAEDIAFETEVRSLTWDEEAAMWEIVVAGPGGERTERANAVITSVGFLNRPNMPEIEGMETFEGQSWHTSWWPQDVDLAGKRVAVIGTGCTGYQLVPELAQIDGVAVTVFQRRPQWLMPIPNYLSEYPEQVRWLDRNLPFHTNFMRFKAGFRTGEDLGKMFDIDPDFDDPDACSITNKALRDRSIAFLKRVLDDDEMVAKMTPDHPFWSARPVLVDEDNCVLHALGRDNVTLVSSGVERIERDAIICADGSRHEVDVIVYATGFRANDYLYPMKITGRGGMTLDELWAGDGARAYHGSMMPGFPNLWAIYGPNTNGGLPVAAFHELTAHYAMQCIEKLILEDKKTVDVREEAYWRFNELVDRRNAQKVWSDPRGHNYYWSGQRSAVMNPFDGAEMYSFLNRPDYADLIVE